MGDRLDIDLSGVADPFAAIPADNYPLTVTSAELTTSQAGNRMVKIEYEVAAGEYAGRKLFDNAVIEGKGANFGLWRLKQLAFAAGVDYAGLDPEELIGASVDAQVTVEPRNDDPEKEQNRVELLVQPE